MAADAPLDADLDVRVEELTTQIARAILGDHNEQTIENGIMSLARELAAARAENTALAEALRAFCEDTECGDGFQLTDNGEHDCYEFRRWRSALAVLARHARGTPHPGRTECENE